MNGVVFWAKENGRRIEKQRKTFASHLTLFEEKSLPNIFIKIGIF